MREEILQRAMDSIGYQFKDTTLLRQAFSHSSYVNEQKIGKNLSYERLEFLGDAVLELLVSEYLYKNHPEAPEGDLTKIRASLVSEYCLAQCARELHYPDYVLLSKGERMGEGQNRDSLLCVLFESVLVAVYLDGGRSAAETYVNRFLLDDAEHRRRFADAKTSLQELVQKDGGALPEYRQVREEGPDHQKTFYIEVYIDGQMLGEGSGRSMKIAEQKAAAQALGKLRNL